MTVWKPIPGFEAYEASCEGNVRNARTGQIRKPWKTSVGRRQLTLTDGPRRENWLIAVAVASAFHGTRPSSDHEAAHCNGNQDDDRASNLRWATAKENAADREIHGNTARGDRNGATKLPDACIPMIHADRRRGMTQYQLADKYQISQAQIWNILHRKQRLKAAARPEQAVA